MYLPNCHYQIVLTKLSPYQVGITKLTLPKIRPSPAAIADILSEKETKFNQIIENKTVYNKFIFV